MTIKGKRAQALSKLDHDAHINGVWVDRSYSHAAVREALNGLPVNLDTFGAFFSEQLKDYRAWRQIEQKDPTVSEQLDYLHETVAFIDQVKLRMQRLPAAARAHVNDAYYFERCQVFPSLVKTLDDNLDDAADALLGAAMQLKQYTDASGRRSKLPRDRLLHGVAAWVMPYSETKERAAATAGDVLRAAGVDAPTDPKELRRIVRRVEDGGEIAAK